MADVSKKVLTVHVAVSQRQQGAAQAIASAFKGCPLAANYELKLIDLPLEPDAKRDAEIIVADPGTVCPVLDSVENLKWVQTSSAGVNQFEMVRRKDFVLTRLGGSMGQQMAEFTIGAIMSEDWSKFSSRSMEGCWEPNDFDGRRRLHTFKLGTLGVGDIPAHIAKVAKAFKMKTIGYATKVRDIDGYDEVTDVLERVLSEADVIVSVLPDTPQTRGLLDNQVLKASGSGKLFINCGRGTLVSEESILEALEQGWLRRAVLDVFAVEPLPESSKLWKHPQVIVTPHVAACTYVEDLADLFVIQLEKWLRNEPLAYLVDTSKGY